MQLWLNLPARDKMSRPKYRDQQASALSESTTDEGAVMRVIAGEAAGGRIVGPVGGLAVAPKFVDVTLPGGTTFREAVPRGHTAFAYVDQQHWCPMRWGRTASCLMPVGTAALALGAYSGGLF